MSQTVHQADRCEWSATRVPFARSITRTQITQSIISEGTGLLTRTGSPTAEESIHILYSRGQGNSSGASTAED